MNWLLQRLVEMRVHDLSKLMRLQQQEIHSLLMPELTRCLQRVMLGLSRLQYMQTHLNSVRRCLGLEVQAAQEISHTMMLMRVVTMGMQLANILVEVSPTDQASPRGVLMAVKREMKRVEPVTTTRTKAVTMVAVAMWMREIM
jgi:hypothetical protein